MQYCEKTQNWNLLPECQYNNRNEDIDSTLLEIMEMIPYTDLINKN